MFIIAQISLNRYLGDVGRARVLRMSPSYKRIAITVPPTKINTAPNMKNMQASTLTQKSAATNIMPESMSFRLMAVCCDSGCMVDPVAMVNICLVSAFSLPPRE